ncbi:hypothetical protein M408DRAFT_328689 [Serendipita vermifera MAFF 305830]|uniref:ER membrane protein complex subunit 10 n=1 Tax=Serendipita vermifera MAFF 305830 TaxID=933852 RepID=A0A0C3BD89_SERVB|nr:hypothetical protein M408DRAFT_328689 [Serendipita vermifera MAFF 305830]
MLDTLLITFILLHSVYARTVNLHHRLLVPDSSAPTPAFVLKGSADLELGSYLPSETAARDLTTYSSQSSSAFYQVALELSNAPQDLWPFSSVDACHLSSATGERITLHTLPSTDPQPYSIDYWLINERSDGSCPKSAGSTKQTTFGTPNWNTTIVTKLPTSPPSIPWRVPPQLSPDGKPVEIKPEPSFIGKYWPYLIGAFFLFAFLLPAPEEEAAPKSK